jgi:hypothetical protein
MATRFYFGSTDGDNPASPAFAANWNQNGEATRRKLYRSTQLAVTTALTSKQVTVPITTTQNILACQFVSDCIPPKRIGAGIVGVVVRSSENATTNNAHLAFILRVVNDDGTIRGTLASSFTTISEFALTASQATRIIGNGTTTAVVTPLTTRPGDRLVLELGVFASAPTAAGSAQERFGTTGGSDFAQTTALTTDLNPWMQMSHDIWDADLNNYRFFKAGSGISVVNERVR